MKAIIAEKLGNFWGPSWPNLRRVMRARPNTDLSNFHWPNHTLLSEFHYRRPIFAAFGQFICICVEHFIRLLFLCIFELRFYSPLKHFDNNRLCNKSELPLKGTHLWIFAEGEKLSIFGGAICIKFNSCPLELGRPKSLRSVLGMLTLMVGQSIICVGMALGEKQCALLGIISVVRQLHLDFINLDE
jgi:hypothetical protein